MPRIWGHCVCTPLRQTVFNLFEIKNAGGQEPMIRLSWPTKTRRHGGENVPAFWTVVQAVYFRCFPAFDFRFLRPIRRGQEHPCQHWHLTKTFSVCDAWVLLNGPHGTKPYQTIFALQNDQQWDFTAEHPAALPASGDALGRPILRWRPRQRRAPSSQRTSSPQRPPHACRPLRSPGKWCWWLAKRPN